MSRLSKLLSGHPEMTTNRLIDVPSAQALLSGRPGLVVGQAASSRAPQDAIQRDLAVLARDAFSDSLSLQELQPGNFAAQLDDLAASNPQAYERFQSLALRYIRELRPSHGIQAIARAPWSVVFSLCLDGNIEDALRVEWAKRITQRQVTVIATATVLGRPTAQLPVFKLLGSCHDPDDSISLALSQSELLIRSQLWRSLVAPAQDYLRDSGLLFLGTSSHRLQVRDLLSAIFAGPRPHPTALLFAESDECALDPVILRLADRRSQIYRVSGDISQILRSLDKPSSRQLSLGLTSQRADDDADQVFAAYSSVAQLVPSNKESLKDSRRQEAYDSLFRPASTRWMAYQCDLDFPRSQTKLLVDGLLSLDVTYPGSPCICLLRGKEGLARPL